MPQPLYPQEKGFWYALDRMLWGPSGEEKIPAPAVNVTLVVQAVI